jgi:hypothetical protein
MHVQKYYFCGASTGISPKKDYFCGDFESNKFPINGEETDRKTGGQESGRD